MPLRCGVPLVIAGIVQDQQYFDELVAPRIDGDKVSFVGAVGPDERSELLGGALALLHLIRFDEPFGYSVVEAMACGTPVIAFNRGSMPELIADGETGFLVDDIDGAVAAVRCVGRARPRGHSRARGRALRRRTHGRRLHRRVRGGASQQSQPSGARLGAASSATAARLRFTVAVAT